MLATKPRTPIPETPPRYANPATRGSTNVRLKRSLTRMASRLRPTPETGTVAATQMPASSIGPSWAKRGSREARLAFRQAQRRGDRTEAMQIAMAADKAGLASQASIGSAEERLAGQYQGRGADTAVVSEISKALTPPGLSRDMIDTPAGPRRRTEEFSSQATATRPPIPEPPAAPGASQPPENPVTGSATPVTGDAPVRLGQRRINPLTGKPIGHDPRNPSPVDVMTRVRELTSAEGGDMMRGAAVKQANAERVAAGQAPVDYEATLDELQASDRELDSTRRTASALNRGPALSADPTLARSFGTPTRAATGAPVVGRVAPSLPAPSRSTLVGGSLAATPARPRTLDDTLRERQEFVAGYASRSRPTGPNAFQGSRAQAAASEAATAASDAAEAVRKRAAKLSAGVKARAKGTAFEGSPVARLFGIGS